MKKLNIRIVYGCGKVSTINCTSRKQVDAECARLAKPFTKIYDGSKYTADFTFEKVK